MNILLKNLTIATQNKNRDVYNGDILVEGNTIKKVEEKIPNPGIEELDLSGLTAVPGFIQSHVHVCQALFRNLADDLELLTWLSDRIWPLEMAHNESSLQTSARLGIYEILSSGVTTILDMGSASHMDIIFEEFQKSGIRAFSGKVMMDSGNQPYKQSTQDALDDSEMLIKKWHGQSGGRIQYALAPRFVPTCSIDLWRGTKELSENYDLIIHTHSSENRSEIKLVEQQTGFRNVEFFVKNDLASSKMCLAHCIWVTEEEIEYLKDYQINVLHCPAANLKLASGIAPVPKMLQKGINIAIGSDGAPCNNNMDIFIDMRLAALIHKPFAGANSITAQNVFDMVTIAGAKALGMGEQIGSIEPGKLADITFLNLNKVHAVPADNIYSQIVYSAHSTDVSHVMADGNWVVQNGTPVAYDQEELIRKAWEECDKLIKRINK